MNLPNEKEPILTSFTSGGLKIDTRFEEHRAFMSWLGQSDSRNPASELNPYLDRLVAELKPFELTISFNHLEYMNSSTVPPIIQFLKKLNTQEVKTLVTYKADSKWQAASFKALETFSRMFSFLTVKGI